MFYMKLRLLLLSSLCFSLGNDSLACPRSYIPAGGIIVYHDPITSKDHLLFQTKNQTAVTDLKTGPVTFLDNSDKKILAEKKLMDGLFKMLAACNGMLSKEGLVSAALSLITKRPDF